MPGPLQSRPVGLWPVPFPLKGRSAQNSLRDPCKTKLSSSSTLLKALTLVQTKRTPEVPHDLAHSLSPPHTDTVTYTHACMYTLVHTRTRTHTHMCMYPLSDSVTEAQGRDTPRGKPPFDLGSPWMSLFCPEPHVSGICTVSGFPHSAVGLQIPRCHACQCLVCSQRCLRVR